ncbi:MAG: GNAT family N-acetyltransferase [Firmicutes bacterium]|nr:GNAT family N-acetyltransferase [Bacillota bacterium]
MISGKNVNLWALERSDLVQNYSWGNDPEVVKLTGMKPFPRSVWELEKWYESVQMNPNVQTYSVKLNDGTYVGNIELSNIDWRSGKAELGVMIGSPSNRSKGWGSEAIMLLCRFAFEEMNLHRIYVRVLSFNYRAVKTFEKCGFIREGIEREAFYTDCKHVDVFQYGILKNEFIEKFGKSEERNI